MMNHFSKIGQCTGLLIDAFIKYPGNISLVSFFSFDFGFMCAVGFGIQALRSLSFHSNSRILSIWKTVINLGINFGNIKDHKCSNFWLYIERSMDEYLFFLHLFKRILFGLTYFKQGFRCSNISYILRNSPKYFFKKHFFFGI